MDNEVDRLRAIIARLEWNRDGRCNGCNGFEHTTGHDADCWVARELRPDHYTHYHYEFRPD